MKTCQIVPPMKQNQYSSAHFEDLAKNIYNAALCLSQQHSFAEEIANEYCGRFMAHLKCLNKS